MSIEKLHYCCRPILPLVFDDALSYYEVLSKVVAKVNETIEAFNSLEDSVNTSITSINNTIDAIEEDVSALQEDSASIENRMDSYVPETDSTDIGKVLTCLTAGTADWVDIPTELPEYGISNAQRLLLLGRNGQLAWGAPWGIGVAGNVLTVNQQGTDVAFSPVPKELPAYSQADAYKLLIMGTGGQLSWGATWGVGAVNNVLTVNSDATLGFKAIPSQLPALTDNNGKVLAVNSDGTGVEWINAPSSDVVLTMGSATVAEVRAAVTAFQSGSRVILKYTVPGSGNLVEARFTCTKAGLNQLYFPDFLRDAATYSGYDPAYSGNTLSTKSYWIKVSVSGSAVKYTYNESQDVFPNT